MVSTSSKSPDTSCSKNVYEIETLDNNTRRSDLETALL